MNTVMFKCAARKLLSVRHQRCIEPDHLRVCANRIRQAITSAEECGIVFVKPYKPAFSLPNLLAHVMCSARYAEWNLHANLSCWSDGEVSIEVFDKDDETFFKLRILKSGYVHTDIRLHRFIRKGVA